MRSGSSESCDLTAAWAVPGRPTRRDLLQASAGLFLIGGLPVEMPPKAIAWSSDVRPGPGPKGAAILPDGTILCARSVAAAGAVFVECMRSTDKARTWSKAGTIVTRPAGADLGDGCLIRMRDGRVLYSYRDNRVSGEAAEYAVRVAVSADGGATWAPHSTVTSGSGATGGLWSSFLLETRAGLQCYYDDERTPWQAGLARHQWLTMRTWDAASKSWVRPVTVSRAHDPAHLSRDGSAAIVELADGRLLCALESVDVRPPHCGVVMAVTSADGGKSWSWQNKERGLVYQPADTRFGAFCPWMVRVGPNRVVCVFGLNEGREKPIAPGTPPGDLGLDVACVESDDGGRTWSKPKVVYAGAHRNALPGVFALPGGDGVAVCHWVDVDRGYLTCEGRL
jgi:hypothetical protein